ncbi:unnamed protein product, partial [Mesorhabditis belari]|uniref:Uncharacterized protein n=1 Tax=Mesorhabditis belari TaxID=2138241 RepID=A0AAF3FEH8_9BILA
MSSARFIPSSYCHEVCEKPAPRPPAAPIVEEDPIEEEEEMASTLSAPPRMVMTRVPSTTSQPAPPPRVMQIRPEPIYSSYAQGAVIPPAYYMQYRQPERVAPSTPIARTAVEQPSTPNVHVHDDETCPYRQHVTPQKIAATPRRRSTNNAPPPHQIPQMLEAAEGYTYEPSSYALGQLNEQLARAPAAHPLGAKKSIYAPVEQEIDAGAPSSTPSYVQTTMETTQPHWSQANAQLGVHKHTPIQAPEASTPRGVHFAPSQAQPAYPQETIAKTHKMIAAMSAYVGGVPNDLMAAYQTENLPSAYRQKTYKGTNYLNQQSGGPSDYHFQHQPSPQASTVTADIQDDEGASRSGMVPAGGQDAALNMDQMGMALDEIYSQLPGHAFAPLNMPPCSEYQFDQLQDLASCF